MRNRWVTDGRDAAGYVHDSVGPTVAFPHKIWLGMAWTGLSHTLMIYFFQFRVCYITQVTVGRAYKKLQ